MNYEIIYNRIISNALIRGLDKKSLEFYTESHHIKPKCLGGSDDKTNLVLLTAREHFIVHMLLVKIYPDEVKLKYPLALFKKHKTLRINSRLFEALRIDAFKGENNPSYGKPSPLRGRKTSDKTRAKQSASHKGKVISSDTKDNMSKARKGRFSGKDSPRYGLPSARRSSIWDFEEELYQLWVYNNKPKRIKFHKLAIDAGYPDSSYRRLIEDNFMKRKDNAAL